jgi:hypothetical protein
MTAFNANWHFYASTWAYVSGGNIVDGDWHHIACTVDDDTITTYRDGVKVATASIASTGILTDLTSSNFIELGADHPGGDEFGTDYINDFRVYDHCLSPKEVKELSKGLILHYKLADAGTTEYDCSGYMRNGTKSSAITASTDSPRYDGCCVFDGSSTYIAAGEDAKVTDEISVCWWGYMSDWSAYQTAISCTENAGWNFQPYSNNTLLCWMAGTGSSSNTYKQTTYSLSKLSSGWHHIVGTYDGLLLKLYVDGALVSSLTAYTTKTPLYYNSANGIFVGSEAGSNTTTPTGPYFSGSLSDFRIYATALSADDVAELYHTSAIADNSGNFYGYELSEGDNLNISKTGVINGSVFQEEDGKTKIGSDGTIYANIFYEY